MDAEGGERVVAAVTGNLSTRRCAAPIRSKGSWLGWSRIARGLARGLGAGYGCGAVRPEPAAKQEARGMKVAILGATHGIGLELTKAALAEGHEVTGLARHPERMPIRHERLHLVGGDAQDFETVAKIVEGREVVFDCLGTKKPFERTTLFSRSAENLAKLLTPEQLLIAVTGIGAGDSRGHGGFFYDRIMLPIFLRRMYADKDRQEAIL